MTFAGSALGIIAPSTVLAGSNAMAGGVFYTKDAPGRWSKKVSGHLPIIKISKGQDGTAAQVVTPHEMKGYDHYIVKHMLLDHNYQFIAETMFNPMEDKAPISNYQLGDYQGALYALSVCNQHDSWLNVVEV